MRRLTLMLIALSFILAIAFAATRPRSTSTVATRSESNVVVAQSEPSTTSTQASSPSRKAVASATASSTTTSTTAPPNRLVEIDPTTTTTLLPQRVPQDPLGPSESTEDPSELPTDTLPPEVPALDFTEEREPKGVLPDEFSGEGSDAGIDTVGGEAGEVYVWYDGEEERRVRIVPNQTDDPVGDLPRDTNDTAGSAATGHTSGRAAPVFIDESTDETLTWDGGIVILLDPEWTDTDTTSFFAAQGFTPDQIEPLPLRNAFVIAVNASPNGIQTAAQLAQLDGVLSASPDWSVEFEPL